MASRISDIGCPRGAASEAAQSNNRRREKQEGRHENGEHRCSEGRRRVEQQLDTNPRKCLWLCLRQWGTRMVMKETQYPYTGPKTQRFLDYVGEID